jgi:hypothetical protein
VTPLKGPSYPTTNIPIYDNAMCKFSYSTKELLEPHEDLAKSGYKTNKEV